MPELAGSGATTERRLGVADRASNDETLTGAVRVPVQPCSDAGAAGFGLLDAVIALAVLLIVLVPVSGVLTLNTKVVSNGQAQTTADGLASGAIDQVRALASAPFPPSLPTSDTCSFALPSITNDGYQLVGCRVVNGQEFLTWGRAGWCGVRSGSTTWGTLATTSSTQAGTVLGYFVEFRVSWGLKVPTASAVISRATSVVVSSSLATPDGYTLPSTATGCPL